MDRFIRAIDAALGVDERVGASRHDAASHAAVAELEGVGLQAEEGVVRLLARHRHHRRRQSALAARQPRLEQHVTGIVGFAGGEDFVVARDQAHFGLRDGLRRSQRIDEHMDAVIAGERGHAHVGDDEPLRGKLVLVVGARALGRCCHDVDAGLELAHCLVYRECRGDVLVQRGGGGEFARPDLHATLVTERVQFIPVQRALEIAVDDGIEQIAVADPEYVDLDRRRIDADQRDAALAGARQHIGLAGETHERLAVAHIDVELGRFRQALLHRRRHTGPQIDVVAIAVLQPLDAKLLAFRGQRRLVGARLRHERREIDAFCKLLRELEAGPRRRAVGIHGVVEQAEAVLVAHLLILPADVGDLAHVERQPQRVQRRAPQFAVGHGPAEHGQCVRFLARIAGALIGDIGRGRGALKQEGLFGRIHRADLEDGTGEPQPVTAVLGRRHGDLAEEVEAGAEIVALEGSVGVGLQRCRGLGDRPRFLLDLGLQLDGGISEVIALEGLVCGERRIQAKRQHGAKSCGAYQTNHGKDSLGHGIGRARHKRQRKGDGLMAAFGAS
ncbi:hypothetical protein ES707_13906 [subsurface metagenome]